ARREGVRVRDRAAGHDAVAGRRAGTLRGAEGGAAEDAGAPRDRHRSAAHRIRQGEEVRAARTAARRGGKVMSRLTEHAQSQGSKAALIDAETGAVMTFDELNRRSIRCARLLRREGL